MFAICCKVLSNKRINNQLSSYTVPPTVSSLTYDCGTRTLTCTSTGSPATTVTWTKGGVTLTVDGTTYSMTQTMTDRGSSTYENVLTLPATGDISGTYGCQVENALGNSTTMTADVGKCLLYKTPHLILNLLSYKAA